jgi:hypothetical protein
MSNLWAKPATGGYSSKGGYSDPWGTRAQSKPSAQPNVAAPPADTSGATPGTFGINPVDPAWTAEHNAIEGGDLIQGLKASLFGTSAADAAGKHGGFLGDVPLVGDLTRATSEVISNVGGAVLGLGKAATDVVGGTLERLPSDILTPGMSAVTDQALRSDFNNIPDDSPIKQAAQAEMDAEHGIANTGWFDNDGHIMSKAIRDYQEEQSVQHPDLFRGLVTAPGSLADTMSNLFGALGVGQRLVERGIAGTAKNQTGGVNRVQEIMAVGSGAVGGFAFGGETQWTNPDGSKSKLSPLESLVYAKVNSGDWNEQEALDFMSSHGSGLSHAAWLQIAGTFATDPLTIGSLGAGAIAKIGVTGADLVVNLQRAESALAAARSVGEIDGIVAAAKDVMMARTATIAAKGSTAKFNLLGKLAESPAVSQGLAKTVGRGYLALDGTAIGRTSKLVRTIIDPMHAFEFHMPGSHSEVDLLSDVASRAHVAAYGPKNHLTLLETLHDITPDLYNQFVDDFAVYSANSTRRIIANEHRAAILNAGLGEELASMAPGHAPSDLMETMLKGHRNDILDTITESANRFRIGVWDEPALDNLAGRMETFYGVKDAKAWREVINSLNDDQRSMLHAGTYGKATQLLLDGVAQATREGSGMGDKLQRLVLLNRNTLTVQGAGGIIDRIEAAGSDLEKAAVEVRAALEQYPDLRYFTFNEKNMGPSIERFVKMLKGKQEHLPMQVVDAEAKTLHPTLQELQKNIEGSYTLGFRPEDEYLWGLERVNVEGGKYAPIGDVWTDHVGQAEAGPGYRAGHYLNLNFRGQPILADTFTQRMTRAPVKAVDYINVMGQVMRQRVSGTIIADAARSKFVSRAITTHGMTEGEAKAIFERLGEMTGETSTVANPRGLSTHNMWQGTIDLVPKRLIGQMDQRDMMKLVLDAYDGDVRFIGATQKLTARAKAVVGNATGVNYLGQIAEHVYPLIKFRMNSIFQLQEKIEPWVLNAQRGARVAVGTKMSPADVITQRNLENMVSSSLVRMGDIDQVEYYLGVLHSGHVNAVAATAGTKLNRLRGAATALTDVQGVKRINMLRTFRKGLGKELKGAWETHSPGVWDEMKADAQLKQGHLISDDDFAVQVMGENMLGNDIVVQRILNKVGGADFKADYKAAISPGAWASPQHMGEMRPLELDTMTQLLGFSGKGGKAIKTQGDLRAAIAGGEVTLQEVQDALFSHGAHPDYVRRVENALQFSWEGFWQAAGERFNLLPTERRALENMMAASASMRGMDPIDFMSQVYWPSIKGGEKGAAGSLGNAVDLLRAPKTGKQAGLAELAAPVNAAGDFVGTREDLVRQLSSVFAEHLDPSAKRALLMEFQPELRDAVMRGESTLGLDEIDRAWAAGGNDALTRSIMDGMNATEGDIFEANLPMNRQEFEAQYPSRSYTLYGDASVGEPDIHVVHTIGDGIEAIPPALRRRVMGAVGRVKAQFPEVDLGHIDTMVMDAPGEGLTAGFTVGTAEDTPSIFLNKALYGPDHEAKWAQMDAYEQAHRFDTHFHDPHIGVPKARESVPGATYTAYNTPEQTLYHEYGHIIDSHMRATGIYPSSSAYARPNAVTRAAVKKRFKEYQNWVDNVFDGSEAQAMLSEYATVTRDEAMGELFSVLLNPDFDMSKFPTKVTALGPDELAAGPRTVQEAVDQLRDILKRNGMMKDIPKATVNPDIIRTHRMFGKWTEGAINQGLLRGGQSQFSGLLNDIARIPTEGAVPYNLTEGQLIKAATEAMQRKWADAYRLQYFAQKRTMFERSLNHPMFGIYPASYMWGKLMPEVVKFIAQAPFGVRTGAMAYSMHNVMQAVGMQREFDPEFDKLINDLGHSQTLWFLGYLLPTLPWDVGASAPTWMRDLAQQGLASQASVDAGGTVVQPDIYRSVKKQGEVINPLRPLNQLHSVAKEIDSFINPANAEPPASVAPNTTPGTGPILGTQLGPTLEEQLQLLQGAISQP